jgi:hypothetical protein
MPTDETPDVAGGNSYRPPYGPTPYGAGAYDIDDIKPWYTSRALLSSFASFGLFFLKHLGIIDWANEMIVQVQAFVVTLGLVFSRVGNKKLVSGRTYRDAVEAKRNSETAEE